MSALPHNLPLRIPDLKLKERAAAPLDALLRPEVPNSGQTSENVVSLNFASWNHIQEWLRRIETLRRAA